MNCKEFKNNLTDLFDKQVDPNLLSEMKAHMNVCDSCLSEYNQFKNIIIGLKPANSEMPSNLGLKQRILTQIKTEDIEMETVKKEKTKIKRWHKSLIAIAASVLFVAAVFMLTNRAPFVNTASAAENIILKSISAMESLRSMFITMDVRSLEDEPFDLVGTDYEFIEYKYWKQFSGDRPWRIEKPGREVVFDGEQQYLYMPHISYAIKGNEDVGFVEWMKIFLDVKNILKTEQEFAKNHDAKYEINKTEDEITLHVSANALGDFHNNFRKNTSVLESDNSRVYVFDSRTLLLKTFTLYINENGKSTKVIELKNIAYNIPIEASTFAIDLPKGVHWQASTEPGFVKAFTKITSKKAAQRFLDALSKEDFTTITPVWDALQISDQNKLEDIKENYGGLEVVSIGEAFKSGLYPGEFVPYTVKLISGEILKFNLALRNDNPTRTWIIDGGI